MCIVRHRKQHLEEQSESGVVGSSSARIITEWVQFQEFHSFSGFFFIVPFSSFNLLLC